MAFSISIPDAPASRQRLIIEGVTYFIILEYNTRSQTWHMSILDEDDEPLIQGIALKLGQNLTFRFLWDGRFNGDFYIAIARETSEPLNRDNLGTDYLLLYLTKAELEALGLEN